jgi:hypothetical protein
MAEISARVNAQGSVELINGQSATIESATAMTPLDAAWLARGLLACAAALAGPTPPAAGAIGGDAHLPIMTWAVGSSTITGKPVLVLSIPPGIELTFVMPAQGAIAVGEALVAQGEGTAPPEGHRGTVH